MKKKFYMFVTVALLMSMVATTGCSLFKSSNTAVQDTVNEKLNTETIEGVDDDGNTAKPVDGKTEPANDNSAETEPFNTEDVETGTSGKTESEVPIETKDETVTENKAESTIQNNKTEDEPKVEESKPEHQHNWVAQYTTVHHDAEYTTVHHDAEYTTIHHDAEYNTIFHEAVFESKPVYGFGDCSCGDKALGSEEYAQYHISLGHTISYPGTPMYYEDPVLIEGPWEEKILIKAAYDERVLIKDAYDEQVETKAAYDEQILNGYTCSCGATK